ncbi:MAG: DUF4173 domain-containing protein [Clostridiales Family XIII bacterium]|nr:DUF4173 domain-containing protein [Clostridiales Family XIII bacterium]
MNGIGDNTGATTGQVAAMETSGATTGQMAGAAQTLENPYYYTAVPKGREWKFAAKDTVFAIAMLALGLLFWEWVFVFEDAPSTGVTAFFAVAAAISGVYLHSLGFKQNAKSLPVLAVLLAGSLPFSLYEPLPINMLLLLFEFAVALIWVMYTCGTSVSERLSGYVLTDIVNQIFVVPFTNFAGAFRALGYGVQCKDGDRRGLYAFLGILISIPLIATVIALLISADPGFADIMANIAQALNLNNIGQYILELILGIPVACYVFGSVFGNSHGRYTDSMTRARTAGALAEMHKIPLAAVRAPLVALTAVYALFFASMGAYLFSAFSGGLPAAFTYAEYARRGFFELCGVASVNLAVVIFVYIFARRGSGEYPRSVRVLTGAISSMTILLIATAASKMLMYIDMYGLTRLRVYTLWFMLLMACVFAVVVIWHLRPFNAGKPITIIFVALVLCLFLSGTEGIIDNYNTQQGKADHQATERYEARGDQTAAPAVSYSI